MAPTSSNIGPIIDVVLDYARGVVGLDDAREQPKGAARMASILDKTYYVPLVAQILDKKGWHVAARFQRIWLSGKANAVVRPASDGKGTAGPLSTAGISMDWILRFERARDLFDEVTSPDVFANDQAKGLLRSRLDRIFQLTKVNTLGFGDLKAVGRALEREYINYRGIGDYDQWRAGIDELTAALGRFNMYVIPNGSATRSGKKTRVTISRIGVFVRDSFDFEGEQDLGGWGRPDIIKPPTPPPLGGIGPVKYVPVEPGIEFHISNASYREYRQKTGRGGDFLIYSDVKTRELSKPIVFDY